MKNHISKFFSYPPSTIHHPQTAISYPLSAIRYPLAIFAALFLCGFNFYSAVKNEEGNKHYEKGQIGKAKSAYEKAWKADPKTLVFAFNLGNAYYKEDDFKNSLEVYKKSAQDEKDPALQSKAFYNLGNALVRSNERDKAAEFYKQALRLDAHDQDAKYNLELLTNKPQEQKKDQNQQNQQGTSGNQGQPQNQKNEGAGNQPDQQNQEQSKQGSAGQKKENQNQQNQNQELESNKPEEEKEKKETGSAKSEAEIRAEQILNALQNQEQQALKMNNKKTKRVQRIVDKDW